MTEEEWREVQTPRRCGGFPDYGIEVTVNVLGRDVGEAFTSRHADGMDRSGCRSSRPARSSFLKTLVDPESDLMPQMHGTE